MDSPRGRSLEREGDPPLDNERDPTPERDPPLDVHSESETEDYDGEDQEPENDSPRHARHTYTSRLNYNRPSRDHTPDVPPPGYESLKAMVMPAVPFVEDAKRFLAWWARHPRYNDRRTIWRFIANHLNDKRVIRDFVETHGGYGGYHGY